MKFMRCSSCDFELPVGAQFCPACGAKQRKSRSKKAKAAEEAALAARAALEASGQALDLIPCHACGAGVELGAKFCPSCGVEQPFGELSQPADANAQDSAGLDAPLDNGGAPLVSGAEEEFAAKMREALARSLAANDVTDPEAVAPDSAAEELQPATPDPDVVSTAPVPASGMDAMLELMRSKLDAFEQVMTGSPSTTAPVNDASTLVENTPAAEPPTAEPEPAPTSVNQADIDAMLSLMRAKAEVVETPPPPKPVPPAVATAAAVAASDDIDDIFAQASGSAPIAVAAATSSTPVAESETVATQESAMPLPTDVSPPPAADEPIVVAPAVPEAGVTPVAEADVAAAPDPATAVEGEASPPTEEAVKEPSPKVKIGAAFDPQAAGFALGGASVLRQPVPDKPKKWLYAAVAGAAALVVASIGGLGYWGWSQKALIDQQAEQIAQHEQAMLTRLAAEAQKKQAEEEALFAEQQAKAEREAAEAKKNEEVLAQKVKEAEERAVREVKQKGRAGGGAGSGGDVSRTAGAGGTGGGAAKAGGGVARAGSAGAGTVATGPETPKQKAEREMMLKLRQAKGGIRSDETPEDMLFTDPSASPLGMTSRAELRRAESNRQAVSRSEPPKREIPSLMGNLQFRLQLASETPERLLDRANQCKSAAECAMVMLAGAGVSSDDVIQAALGKAASFTRAQYGDRGTSLEFENQGLAEHKAGNYARAVEWLEQAVAADPSSPVARTSLASSLMRARQFERGAYVLESSLALDPSRTATWIEMAHYFSLRGDGSSAVNAMTVAYKLWPNKRLAKAYFRSQSTADERPELRPIYQAALRSVEVIPLRAK